jgi:putative membrane protein
LQWWPLVPPLEGNPRLHSAWQLLYLLAGAILQFPLFFMLTFLHRVFYPTYVAAPRITSLTPIMDQQLGGIIMKVSGMLVMFIAVAFVFGRWYQEEKRLKRA